MLIVYPLPKKYRVATRIPKEKFQMPEDFKGTIRLSNLVPASEPANLYGIDFYNQGIKWIHVKSKKSKTIYECPNKLLNFIVLKPETPTDVAVKIMTLEMERYELASKYNVVLLITDSTGSLKESKRTRLNEVTEWKGPGGSLIQLRKDSVLCAAKGMKNIHEVLLSSPRAPNKVQIPAASGEFIALSHVKGDKDFLAMSFWSPDSIGLFSFAGDRLQKLETINLDFSPSQILWIPCYATLFVSRLGNSKGFTAVSFQNIRNLSPSPVEFIDIISQEVEIESWAIVSIKSEDLSKLGYLVFFDYLNETLTLIELC